jgi:hypothetical protein
MPAKLRVAKDRRPSFSPEALSLFLELEGMSQHSRAFKDGSRRLARLLNLVDEWWTGQHVNDRSAEPCHSPEYIAHEYWYRCRAVRAALLAAVGPLVLLSNRQGGRHAGQTTRC